MLQKCVMLMCGTCYHLYLMCDADVGVLSLVFSDKEVCDADVGVLSLVYCTHN